MLGVAVDGVTVVLEVPPPSFSLSLKPALEGVEVGAGAVCGTIAAGGAAAVAVVAVVAAASAGGEGAVTIAAGSCWSAMLVKDKVACCEFDDQKILPGKARCTSVTSRDLCHASIVRM